MQRLCDPALGFRLVSVFEDRREATDTAAEFPRPYHALSFRIIGQATFCSEQQRVTVGDNSVLYMPADTPYHLSAGVRRRAKCNFFLSRQNAVNPLHYWVYEHF